MATAVLAVDPGHEQSGWVLWDGERILGHAIEPNATVLARLSQPNDGAAHLVLEQVEAMGMAVGREVFETVFWTGRFLQAWPGTASRLPRRPIKLHICGHSSAKDSNIRVALIDRFGGTEHAKGTKRAPGPLFGIKSHEWAALALAVTWWDQQSAGRETCHAQPA
jgi:hypothetical protein